jgi:hypothetical protein
MRSLVFGIVLITTYAGLSFGQAPVKSALDERTFGTTVVLSAGLRGTVYAIPEDTTVLPDFEHGPVQRLGEIWTNTLNVPPRRWRVGFPGLTDRYEWFAIDYEGRFWIDRPGRYTIALISDDGSRLYLDDTPVIDNDCQHPPDLRVSAVKLEGGGHRIRVAYFQGPRDCLALVLAVAGPDHEWRIFSTEDFKAPSNPETWNYPSANTIAIVPTLPREASLTVSSLFHQLANTDPNEKFALNPNASGGCRFAEPVRSCSK